MGNFGKALRALAQTAEVTSHAASPHGRNMLSLGGLNHRLEIGGGEKRFGLWTRDWRRLDWSRRIREKNESHYDQRT